jgi:hypothetical protein
VRLDLGLHMCNEHFLIKKATYFHFIPIGKEFPDGLYPKFGTESIKHMGGRILKMWGRTWPLPPCPRQLASWFGNGSPGALSYTEKAKQKWSKDCLKTIAVGPPASKQASKQAGLKLVNFLKETSMLGWGGRRRRAILEFLFFL